MTGPLLTVIAGSNGCGKSTLTGYSSEEFQHAPVLDPDAMGRSLRDQLPLPGSEIEAGRQILLLADTLIKQRQSFTVETTLSGSTYLRMGARARDAGYQISAVLIGTDAVEINIRRVKARVEKGGHDIAESAQRRRWPRTLRNMTKLLELADRAVILDNSSDAGYLLVGAGGKGGLVWQKPLPGWAVGLHAASLQGELGADVR